jgi:hypothetical protein
VSGPDVAESGDPLPATEGISSSGTSTKDDSAARSSTSTAGIAFMEDLSALDDSYVTGDRPKDAVDSLKEPDHRGGVENAPSVTTARRRESRHCGQLRVEVTEPRGVQLRELPVRLVRHESLRATHVGSKLEQLLERRRVVRLPSVRELLTRSRDRVIRNGEGLSGQPPEICAQSAQEVGLCLDELRIACEGLLCLSLLSKSDDRPCARVTSGTNSPVRSAVAPRSTRLSRRAKSTGSVCDDQAHAPDGIGSFGRVPRTQTTMIS